MKDQYIVVVQNDGQDTQFLTIAGRLSPEYPDAEIFASLDKATKPAVKARKHLGNARIAKNYGCQDEAFFQIGGGK